jgi:hypothetical protein
MRQGNHIQVREKDNRTQMPGSYLRADESPQLPCGEQRTQALEQIRYTG